MATQSSLNSLNPFLIRATFERTGKMIDTLNKCCLNPFLIRATFESCYTGSVWVFVCVLIPF